MKNPLIILSESFQSELVSTPLTEAVFIAFCYDHMNEDHPVVYQNELSLMKRNVFQSLESKKMNKA
jgi:hypothetical protein